MSGIFFHWENEQRKLAKLAAEQAFLQTLDWTADQLLTYGERISGINRRLRTYLARSA